MMWMAFRLQGVGCYTVQLYRCITLSHGRYVYSSHASCRSYGRKDVDVLQSSHFQSLLAKQTNTTPQINEESTYSSTYGRDVSLLSSSAWCRSLHYAEAAATTWLPFSSSKFLRRRGFSHANLGNVMAELCMEIDGDSYSRTQGKCDTADFSDLLEKTHPDEMIKIINTESQDSISNNLDHNVTSVVDTPTTDKSVVEDGLVESSVDSSVQAIALDAAFELRAGETMDWNNKQLCKISHRNLLLYAYNHLDMATVVKITNQVLAAYQTLPRRKKASQRRQYVQKFLRCIRKHRPQEDHPQLARWMLRCIDLLTCHDLYSMLRVRHILNYDNSFETFRASFGIENFETFSNVRETKEQQNKIMEEKALKGRTAQRNLLMRHLKINKFRFMKDHNVTKAVYEANIEWTDAIVNAAVLDEERFAFIYNLPFIDHNELSEALHEVLTRFSKVKKIDILSDRIPPLTSMVKRSALPRNTAPPPKDRYSPLYALVEFESKEDRDYICDEHIRIFGLICCGRVVYPELAERKHSILTALYPPFKRMTEALQFIANALTEQSVDDLMCSSAGDGVANLTGANVESIASSQCKITPSSKRKKGAATPTVVTADAHHGVCLAESHSAQQAVPDNHVDSSMLEKLRNKNATTANMDPQWVVLRFQDFKHAYFARIKLMRKLADEPRSLVSFDTKRSIFHNGKYVDLPLFQYSTRTENDPAVARIAQSSVDECDGYRSLTGESP